MTDAASREAQAIARLLADPDPGIVVSMRKQLARRHEDPPGLREAIEALDDPGDRSRAREARLDLGRDRARDRLVRLSDAEPAPDLEEGALEIARLEDPDLDARTTTAKLDDLGSRAKEMIAAIGGRERLLRFARFMGEEEGFAGDPKDPDVARGSSLPLVLEHRRGLPIALSLVYLLVAARAGLALFGVGAPLHFIVGGPTETTPLYLDPYNKGRALDQDGVAQFLRSLGVVPFRIEYVAPVRPRQILARMARNLIAFHASRTRMESRTKRYVEVAAAMEEAQ